MCSDFAEHGRLRLSKNCVFPTICVLTSQNTDVRKFPCGNFLPLKVKNPRYTPPDLLSFNIFKVRGLRAGICKANSIKRKGTPTACLFSAQRALSPAAFCLRQNRQDRRSAERRIKFPIKVQLCRTFIPLPAPRRRGRPCRAGARGVSFSVSPEPKTYPGGTASPLEFRSGYPPTDHYNTAKCPSEGSCRPRLGRRSCPGSTADRF